MQPNPSIPPASTRSVPVKMLLGCGALIGVLCILLVVAAIVMPKNGPAPTPARHSSTPNGTSAIAASLRSFQSAIPVLQLDGVTSSQVGRDIEHTWKAEDGANWMKFRDDGGDNSLEQVVVCTEFTSSDKTKSLVAIALPCKAVEVASGTTVDSREFSDWINQAIDKGQGVAARSFGALPVSFRAIKTQTGATFLFTLGAQQ